MTRTESLDQLRATEKVSVSVCMALIGAVGVLMHRVNPLLTGLVMVALVASAYVSIMRGRGFRQPRDAEGRPIDLLSWPAAFLTAGGGIAGGVLVGLLLLHLGL